MMADGTPVNVRVRSFVTKIYEKIRSANAKTLMGILLANSTVQVINIGTGIISARALGPFGRGELAAIIIWPQFFGYALDFGIPVALIYYMKKWPKKTSELTGAAIAITCGFGVLAMAIGVIALPFWVTNYSTAIVHFAQLCMLLTPVTILGLLAIAILRGYEDFATYNILAAAAPAFTLLCLLIAWGCHALTPFIAAALYILAPIPVVAINFVILWKRARPTLHHAAPCIKALLSYGTRYCIADFAGVLSAQADRAVIAGYLIPTDLGLYVVAQSSARLLTVVSNAVSTFVLPKAAALETRAALSMVSQRTFQSGIAATLIAIPLAFIGPWLIELVYGRDFTGIALTFRILLAANVVGVMNWVLIQGLTATGQPGRASLSQTAGVIGSVILLILLTPVFGTVGAATSVLIANIIKLAMICVFSRRHMEKSAEAQS